MAKKKNGLQVVGNIDFKDDKNGLKVVGKVDFDDNNNITNKTAYIQPEKLDLAPTQKDTWLKKGALDDSGYGYTSGLDAFNRFNAGLLLSGVDFADNIFLGMSKPVEGIGDFAQSRTADVLEYFGKNKQAENIRKSAAKEWKVNEQLENLMNNDVEGVGIRTSSFLGNKGVSIPQGLGSVALASMTGGVGGALGGATAANIASLGSMGIGAAGSAEQEALEQGATRKEARMYGLISGAGETLSEMMFGGLSQGSQLLGIGKGVFDSADDALASSLSKKVNSKIAKTLIEAGVKASSEGVEEVVSGILNAAGKKLTYMKDEDITKLIKDENLLDSFLSGAISAGLSQAPGVIQNIQNTTKGNYKSYLTGLSENEQTVVDKVAENRFKEGMSVKEQAKIREEVKDQLTNLELTSDEINNALDSEMIGDPSDTYLHQIVKNEESIFMPTEEDMTGDKRRLNKNLSIEDAQEKIKTLANDFMKEENDIRNTRAAHKLFNEMKNVIEATGEQVRLTSYKELENQGVVKLLTNENGEAIRDAKGRLQYTDNNGKLIGINGFRSENGITLNANSNALFEATMGHEIGESIKANSVENYNELRNLVTELGKIDGTLTKETMDALRKSYGELGERTDSYLDEYVNDKLGELFTNDSKLINELGKKPSLMQRVIDEVKYLVKKFTTKSPEGKRLLELQHNLENKLQESVRELNVQEGGQDLERIKKADITPIKETTQETKQEVKKETKKKEIIPTKVDIENNEKIQPIRDKYNNAIKETGNKKTIVLSNGEKLTGNYKLVESGVVTPSHNSENFTMTENFPTTLDNTTINDRDYQNDKNAQQLVKEKAQNYDGRAFNDNGVIITKDGIVVSGNDRTMAGEIAARNNTDSDYIEYLKENAKDFGFTQEQIESMDHPRVVLELNDDLDYDTQTFAKFNKDTKKSKSVSEKAKEIRKTVDQNTINRIADILNDYEKIDDVYNSTKASRELLDLMLNKGIIDTNEVSELYDGSKFTGAGKDLVEATVLGSVISEDNLKFFRNNNDLKFKMMKSAPAIIQNQTLGDYSIIDEINKAIEVYKNAQQSNMTVDELNNQTSLFGDSDFDLVTKKIAETLETRGFRNFLNFIDKYNFEAQAPANGQVDMFSGDILSKESVLKQALNIDDNTPLVRFSLTHDNQGRELSEQQQEYFKDSKATDENGNLLVLYHGTPSGGFNEFDMNFRGATTDITGNGDYGKGFYFTPDEKYAQRYSENDTYNKGDKQVYQVYLDMKNPLRLDVLNDISKGGFELIKEYGWENTTEEMYDKLYAEHGLTREEFEQMDRAKWMLEDNWQDIDISDLGYDGVINENRKEFIVFNSNQIKNVDNLNPTNDADIRYQLGKDNIEGKGIRSEQITPQDIIAPLQEQVQELTNTVNELKETIKPKGEVIEEAPDDFDINNLSFDDDIQNMTVDDINLEPFLEGLQKASDRQAERQQLREELNQKREVKIPKETNGRKAWNKFKSLFVNEFAVVDDYAKRHNAPEIKHKTDTWNNYLAAAQYNIENAQTDMNGKAIGRSGNSIFQEAQKLGLKDTFDTYLKHWANVDRAKQGKGANYEAQESYKIVKEMEAKNPELKRLGKDMWQYYRNARHNLRDAGIINQQTSDMLGRMYPHYTPYVSENIENYFTPTGELKPKSTIKRAKGGAVLEGLLSAEEAMQMYTKSQFNTIFGNDVFKSIVNTSNNQVEMVDNRTSYVNADNLYTDKDGYYLTAYENGDAITAKISEEMYKALSRESKTRVQDLENTFRPVGKVLSTLSNIRRNILTSLSPTFIAKNFIKDYQEALFNSKYTADFAKNYPSAFKELATNTGEAQQFKALYGSGLTMGQFDMDSINYNPNAKNFNFLKGIKNANELIELAPRYAEFKASRENGASIQEAMYNAREVTTNFSRGGVITKAFNKYGMTFLNSSVQGFDKFIRNFSGENGAKGVVNSLAKAVIFGIAPAVFNELAFGTGDDKDEEYEAIPDYIKDNYYIIKTGDGNFIRIPKGRVFSVFGSAARRTIEMMEGEENAFDGFLENTQQQIGINNPEENNIFAPFIQAMGGRKLDSGQTAGSAWYGGDIIPSRLQKERPEDQYDASIDKFSIWLGQQTGISPYKINYVLDQYSGGIGDLILPMITDEANSDGSIIAPIKDQFTADSTTDNKYVSEFYDTKGKLYTGSKATDEDVLKNKYMNSISSEMAKLYAERREVQADDSLTKKQKYAKSQEIKAEINRLAKEGMDNYNDIIMSNNYAKIGDTEYYKNANGQWTKVNDDVASLGLDTEEKNEYYKVKNEIYTTKKNNDGYDKPLVIQDIVNSNLTPDAKVNLYTSNYKDDLVQPLVDSGMDVDSYLEYKQQDFSADKDRNGKSISGSKKRKVFDYINSMNIPYEQKLILAKSEYNSFNQNNYDIINYIENSGMSYDERIELYKNLGFKVDGDSISW